MKKALSILIAMMLVLCLGGVAAAEGTTYHIGICQLVQHVALDAATQGFQDALKEKLGDAVVFDLQNASGDTNTCSTIMNGFVSNNVNLIMANATPALQAAVAATGDIPILGTSVTDYATALDISDWSGATGINVSGTSDLAPLDQQAAMLHELFPDAKTVGLLYCSAEPNSKYQADSIRGFLEERCREEGTPYTVTVSIGWDTLRGETDSFQKCAQRADGKLYDDKRRIKSRGAAGA